MSDTTRQTPALPLDNRTDVTNGDFPLLWWRRSYIGDLGRVHAGLLGNLLPVFDIDGLDDWRAAAQGDAATAIQIALAMAFDDDDDDLPLIRDLAASALLRCAIDGDAAACVVLDRLRFWHSNIIERREA